MILRTLVLLLIVAQGFPFPGPTRQGAAGGASFFDTDLIVRYNFAEAASGTSPADSLDISGVGSAFNLTNTYATAPTIAASGAVRASNVVTITVTVAHGASTGETVTISGVDDSSFNGTFAIASVPSSTSLTYSQAGGDTTSSNGTASVAHMEYTATSGDRGLSTLSNIGGSQAKARKLMDNTSDKVRDTEGGTAFTILQVIDPQAFHASGSRVGLQIERAEVPRLGFQATSSTSFRSYFNNTRMHNYDGLGTGRQCIALVVDTSQATANDRVKVYKNGTLQTPSSTTDTPTLNETLSMGGTSASLIAMNNNGSATGSRPLKGIVYFAEYFNRALTAEQVDNNCTLALALDDTP